MNGLYIKRDAMTKIVFVTSCVFNKNEFRSVRIYLPNGTDNCLDLKDVDLSVHFEKKLSRID